jgi:hypothetical protein
MSFFNERCPNCSRSISKEAGFCRHCGCPTANSWSNCPRCAASVGTDAQFCWKCGAEQDQVAKRSIYSDRWHRSPTDFAVRVEISVPEKAFHHGLQVDDGTLALLFQNGRFVGTLDPGYHTFDTFMQRLFGFDKGAAAHAILLDMQAAEIDFQLEDIRTQNEVPIDVRLRLLFQVAEPKLFADRLIQNAASFSTNDLANCFQTDVRQGVQWLLKDCPVEKLMSELRVREMLEAELVKHLAPTLLPYGLRITGVRLADFGGPAIELLRQRLGEINQLNREADLNRRLRDVLRNDKITAFRDEQELNEAFEQVTHEYGFKAAQREEERKRFLQAGEHHVQLEGLRLDYERRRAEVLNRLDEQTLRQKSELADVHHELEINRTRFEEEMRRQRSQFQAAQEQQVVQATTDLEVARQGIEALRLVSEAKLGIRQKNERLSTDIEAERLKIRGDASLQALLATMSGEQADRLLKLAELEMRKGLTAEQALALVAEKSPEIAPAVAAALSAKYGQPKSPPTAP